ncbi:MAG TPA: hypothetical protein PLQ12_03620, partial [Candidatus Defluviicoccus seviourii]|nr:hypothetical protein [Candidatus Defluviicoccus seviourii]
GAFQADFAAIATSGVHAAAAVLAGAPDHAATVARLQGYEGDACGECGNFTLVRNGTCLKCTTCGSTTGCS